MWIDDQLLKRCHEPEVLETFVPQEVVVVLGASNNIDLEVNRDACRAQGIPVLRRYGGGGTVVLYPGCVVLSYATWVKRDFHNQLYFDLLNQSLIRSLADLGVPGLTQNGISDVAFEGKKIVGTSLFRSRNYLLYQASILVDLNLDLIAQCLQHPSREPEYRAGRDHRDFLTGLSALNGDLTPASVVSGLQANFPRHCQALFVDEGIEPVTAQFENLLKRASRGTDASL